MPENFDLIGGMKKTNRRAARAVRTSVEFLDVVCQTAKWNLGFIDKVYTQN